MGVVELTVFEIDGPDGLVHERRVPALVLRDRTNSFLVQMPNGEKREVPR